VTGDRSPDRPVDPATRSVPAASGGPPSGAPPLGARLAAFGAIILAGICGGLIGFGFVDLQCDGSCGTQQGVGALVGAIGAAVGTAIVAVLTLRAMGEWAAGGKRRD
jgi:hypothetical protein